MIGVFSISLINPTSKSSILASITTSCDSEFCDLHPMILLHDHINLAGKGVCKNCIAEINMKMDTHFKTKDLPWIHRYYQMYAKEEFIYLFPNMLNFWHWLGENINNEWKLWNGQLAFWSLGNTCKQKDAGIMMFLWKSMKEPHFKCWVYLWPPHLKKNIV